VSKFVDGNKVNTEHDDVSALADGFSPVGEEALKWVSGGAGLTMGDFGGEASSQLIPKLERLN
jgi:hypothetical protein